MKPYYHDEACGITIYNCDCREILPSLKADVVVTDPPYSVSVSGSAYVSNGTRNLDFFVGDDDWPAMTAAVVEGCGLAADALGPDGSFYAWCGHRQFGGIVAALEARRFSTRFLVWTKACPPPKPPNSGWGSAAELCVYGYRPGRTWNEPDAVSNVLHSDSYRHGMPGKLPHPTQKPPSVITPLVLASSGVGQTVLDPFMGSGTTLVAAKLEGRKAIGIEIEERYCEIAAKRLAQGVLPFEAIK